MAIPNFQDVMLPFLEFASDEKRHKLNEVVAHISKFFKLTEEEKNARVASGNWKIIDNRVAWVRTYLKKAGLVEYPERGYFKITEEGKSVLEQKPKRIDVKFLKRYPEFLEFHAPKKKEEISEEENESETPSELLERGESLARESLAKELLDKLKSNSPTFFENIIVDLLTKMGYGKGKVTGGSYDGGIDGIIYQDELGVDKIYLQAKRYAEGNLVSPNMIKNFIASLDIKGANKGIFITTSRFVGNVEEICDRTPKNIIMIDGKKLVELMIKHNVGIIIRKNYELKDIDENYFEE